jgi:hypothetical protein
VKSGAVYFLSPKSPIQKLFNVSIVLYNKAMTRLLLSIFLAMALVAPAAAQDSFDAVRKGIQSARELTDIGAKPTSDTSDVCTFIHNSEYQSINQYEVGFSPDSGAVKGNWTIVFGKGTFQWQYSDIVEKGSYACRGDALEVKTSSGRFTGARYDRERKVLIWDGVEYKRIYRVRPDINVVPQKPSVDTTDRPLNEKKELNDALRCLEFEKRDDGTLVCKRFSEDIKVKVLRNEIKEKFETKREEAKKGLERRREEFKERLEEERKEAKTRFEVKREELKEEVAKIKDERKQETVNRLYERVNELNERTTDRFSDVLEKMEKILDNIASRADKAEVHELDVSAVRTAINDVHGVITSARTAVEAQAGRVYSFDVITEENLRTDVGEVRQMLHGDLTAVKETVQAAHVFVRNAATTLAQIPRVDNLEVETKEPENRGSGELETKE